jgi:membrane protein implicated in regulation of membrane protease activity
MADQQYGTLTVDGTTWRVVSPLEVIDTDGDSVLVEVWITRGEGSDEPE